MTVISVMMKTTEEVGIGIIKEELEEISLLETLRKTTVIKELVISNQNSSNISSRIKEVKVESRNTKKENLVFNMKEK